MTNAQKLLMIGGAPWLTRRDYPKLVGGLEAWFDETDPSSMIMDSANRVSLIADKSGNSSTNVLCLNGVAGNYASAPDAAYWPTGDIDVRWYGASADWTPGAATSLIGKFNTTGNQRSWLLLVNTTGTLQFNASTDGANSNNIRVSDAALGYADFSSKWLRATRVSATGVITLWSSDDGSTWSVIPSTQTATTAGAIYDSTALLEIGSLNGGTTSNFTGLTFRSQVYNGIAGTLAFDANFALPAKLAPSFTESSSNAATVTINTSGATGARISGARDLYQGTVASQPIYLPWSGSNYGYLNGVSGNTITTPDNAAFAGATACDVRVWVVPSDVALGGKELFSQYFSAGNKRVFALATDPITSTKIGFFCSQLGTPVAGVASSVAATMSNGVGIGLRATWRASDGRVQFFTRSDFAGMPDSTGWTQLGTDQTIAGVASLYDSDQPFYIGGKQDQATNYPGRYLYADARVAIDGARIVCFDPAGYSSGQSFAGPTGETWTIASGATIVTRTCLYFDGSNDYLKAAAFALSQPETVYFVGSQVTWADADFIYDGGADASMGARQSAPSPQLNFFAGSFLGQLSGLATATNGIITAVFNGASSSAKINRGTAVTGNTGTTAPNGFTLGSRGAGTALANITAQEVVIYSAAHTTAQQDRVIRYLARKHRLPAV